MVKRLVYSGLLAATGALASIAADLDLAGQERIRETLPALANRRPQAYVWPEALAAHPEAH